MLMNRYSSVAKAAPRNTTSNRRPKMRKSGRVVRMSSSSGIVARSWVRSDIM